MAAVMLQGTGSDVGKSVLVAGLCRLFTNHGLRVRPFKPQNMSNNAAVTESGGEIGRAQALQAFACRVSPTVDMNPVLIKPQSDTGAQLILHGRVCAAMGTPFYMQEKRPLLGAVLASFQRLNAQADLVVVEGAGSPAEVNLRAGDIANMGFARAANVPVVLVADIDRGGVIASVVGTHAVLSPPDAAMIRGFLINKFRGDVSLFDSGYAEIEERTGWMGLGIVPWIAAARALPAEDAVVLDRHRSTDGALVIAVPMLSRIANFDDFDPLRHEPGVRLVMVPPGNPLPADASLVILPGTKATIADLAFMRAQGWDIDLAAHVRRGGRVLGICGGYQMLGQSVADPEAIEGPAETVAGLGYLPVRTTLTGDKRVTRTQGVELISQAPFEGYEIHSGRTVVDEPDASGQREVSNEREAAGSRDIARERDITNPGARPLLRLADGALDGLISADERIAGCYMHGLFDRPEQRSVWLARLGATSDGVHQAARVDAALDALAEQLERVIDIERLVDIALAHR